MSVGIGGRALSAVLLSAAMITGALASPPDAPPLPELPPSQWQLKQGAPQAVGELLDRAKHQRELDFATQLRAVELAQKGVRARKAGRVVRDLKAPEGWRAVPVRGGDGVEYAFRTPQVKGSEVVKAERTLDISKRRLAEVMAPDYLPKPFIRAEELKEGAAGTVSITIIQQVSSTEAVVRVDDLLPALVNGKPVPSRASKEVYLSDFPAGDYAPGRTLTDWTIEVIGTTTYQGENGRVKNALHAKPLDWRKWIQPERRPARP
jgi:hypothetical protein